MFGVKKQFYELVKYLTIKAINIGAIIMHIPYQRDIILIEFNDLIK